MELLPTTSPSSMTSVAPSHLPHQYYILSLHTQYAHTYNSVSTVQVQTPPPRKGGRGPYSPPPKRAKREFTHLPCPISHMSTDLVSKGYLQLLPPSLLPNPLPWGYNVEEYCSYHQSPEHFIDNCKKLKHDIQNLIDQETISIKAIGPL